MNSDMPQSPFLIGLTILTDHEATERALVPSYDDWVNNMDQGSNTMSSTH